MSLQVLDLVAQLLAVGAEGASVTELCQRTGIPRPTMSGQLARLQAGGWVERVARGSYRAGPVALQRFAGGVGSLPGQRGTLVLAAHPDEEVLLIYEGFRALVEGQGFRAQLRSLPPEPPPDWDAVQLEALLPVAEPVRGLAFYADATIGGGFLEALLQRRLPAVALGQTDHQAIDTVTIDVAHGSRAVVDALVAAGRRRIVYLHDPELAARQISLQWRRTGYEHALRQHGLQPQVWELGSLFGTAGEASLRRQLGDARRTGREPDAVFCGVPGHAEYLAGLCASWGLSVPGDLVLVGTGRGRPAGTSGLGYLREPLAEAGRVGALRLLARLLDPGCEPCISLVPPVLDLGGAWSGHGLS